MKRSIIIALAGILCVGCGEDLYDFMNRNINAPVVSAPWVECFKAEREIDVYWDADDAADEYLLYRETDPMGMFNTICYRGQELHFKDVGLQNDTCYYYKLAKRRAERIFDKSDCVMGVAHDIRRDLYEPNNTRETATEFYNVINANIYYYRSNNGNELEDIDWYWVEVDPVRFLHICIWFDNNSNLEDNEIYFMEEGQEEEYIIGEKYIDIINNSNETCIKYFRIGVNKEQIEGSGKIGSYQIYLDYIAEN